jgi:hypothetical protein
MFRPLLAIPHMTVGDRINQLVNCYHGGNVKRAAHDLRMSATTLGAAIRAERKRATKLQHLFSISRFYHVEFEWLRTGAGYSPAFPDRGRAALDLEWMRWYDLLWYHASFRCHLESSIVSAIGYLPWRLSSVRKIFDACDNSQNATVPECFVVAVTKEVGTLRALVTAIVESSDDVSFTDLIVGAAEAAQADPSTPKSTGIGALFVRADGTPWKLRDD